MATSLHYHLVTPEKLFASGEAEMIVIPGVTGDFGVMRDHVPLISLIRPGVIEIHGGTGVEKIFISDGYAETHGDTCTILAETLERLADIDRSQVQKAHEDAKFALEHAASDTDRMRAEKSLALAEARLAAAGSLSGV